MVITVATNDEVSLVPDYCFYPGVNLIVTGIGYWNVFASLKDVPRDEAILNIGFAGSNKLKKGTMVRVSESRLYAPNAELEEKVYDLDENMYLISKMEGFPCYTAGDFVLSTDIKEACLFDMELYAIASMGFQKITSYKVVSDNLSMEEYKECTKK